MENIKKWGSNKENLKVVLMIFMAIVLVVILKIRFGGKAEPTDVSLPSGHETEINVPPRDTGSEIRKRKMVRTSARTGGQTFESTKPPPFLGRDLFSSRKSSSVPTRRVDHMEQEDIDLTATIIDSQGALAIIGNDVFGVGDMVQGFRVMSIKNNEVLLSKDKRMHILRLKEE